MSSEGILRLDLDLEGAVMPNGAHHDKADGTQTVKEDTTVPKAQPSAGEPAEKKLELISEEKAEPEPEASTQKKVIKPPMPPNKGAKSSPPPEEEPPDNVDVPEKKVSKMSQHTTITIMQSRNICLSVYMSVYKL